MYAGRTKHIGGPPSGWKPLIYFVGGYLEEAQAGTMGNSYGQDKFGQL
jgi:hypothetical protein